MKEKLRIALQKSGRLHEGSLQLLRECGIKIANGKNTLIAPSSNFPLEVLYLRDDDIPQYVEDGTADIGILGENVVLEADRQVNTLAKLGFSKCRLSLALPKAIEYGGLNWFEGKRIATSYPGILQNYFSEKNIQVDIHEISGSVEIAPNIGLADAICDIVSSGSTLFSNGLKEVEILLRSEAVLIGNPQLPARKQKILDRLLFRIRSVQEAGNNKYIVLNAPNDKIEQISTLLPGIKSPTIVPLAQEGWSALHSVLSEDVFWEKIDALKENGAQGILVVPIEKMIR